MLKPSENDTTAAPGALTLTRRRLIVSAGVALAAYGAGRTGFATAASGNDATTGRFVSRPDLAPPAVAVTLDDSSASPGLIFLAPLAGTSVGPLIIDRSGQPVWFRPLSPGLAATALRVQSYRGKQVLTWWQGVTNSSGWGEGAYHILDATYNDVARVHAADGLQGDLHEFVITSRNTALIAGYAERTENLTAYGGPTNGTVIEGVVQEIDIATGRLLFEWRSRDHVGLDESLVNYPTAGNVFDYFHLNSIAVAADGDLLVSARHTSTVYKIDRRTGAIVWRLGGKRSDFAIGAGAAFEFQHHVRQHSHQVLTVFDNGSDGISSLESVSRALRLVVDEKAKRATLVQAYANPSSGLAWKMGSTETLPDGGMFVGWGALPEVSEFAPGGALRYRATLPAGVISYRAHKSEWQAAPATKPAVVVQRSSDGSADVYVSWNGATEVAAWSLLGGSANNRLSQIATVRRSGFETHVQLPVAPAFLAVAAVDQTRATLGRSRTVAAHGSPATNRLGARVRCCARL
jgi:hypothetical protein